MRAVQMTAVGGPEVLESVETPEPEITSPTQIKVRLRGAGVNPIDTKIRSRGLFYEAEPPAVLGCDGAGEVVEIGSEVDRFTVGDRVWFCHGGLGREPGNYAEYTVLEQAEAERMPASTDFHHAAAGPLVLITAWEALFDQARLRAGETVLIQAGAGGVGHVAIQLAKSRGARVLATAGSEEGLALCRELGADAVIDYRAGPVSEQVLAQTGGQGVDVCLESVGPDVFRDSITAMAPYGRLVTLLDPGRELDLSQARSKNLIIAFTLMLTPMLMDLRAPRLHHGEILRECAALIDSDRLHLHLADVLPLAQAREAHQRIQQGHVHGKLVLDPTT